MQRATPIVFAFALLTGAAAHAEDPNINVGMWKTTTTTTLISEQFDMPPRTDTSEDCITPEKIAEGQAFLEESEECEFLEKDVRADGLNYTMRCDANGTSVNMKGSMEFSGDSMTGNVDGDMESPMGMMEMKIEIEGSRIGDC